MTKEKREFYKRVNDEINEAFARLRYEFDISSDDMRPDLPEWHLLRAETESLLLKAYVRNHSWIAEAA